MTEYNSFGFDQSPWLLPSAPQQSPPFQPYVTDGLNLLDQNGSSSSHSHWSSWFPQHNVEPSTAEQGHQVKDAGLEGSHSQQLGSPLSSSTNHFIPPPPLQQQLPQRSSPYQSHVELEARRNSLQNIVDPNHQQQQQQQPRLQSSTGFELNSPSTNPNESPRGDPHSQSSLTGAPPLASSIALHSFLNGFNPPPTPSTSSSSSNPYALPSQITQEDYIRFLKQAAAAQAQHHATTNSMYSLLNNNSAPSPSASAQRPDSANSSSNQQSLHHSHQQPMYPLPQQPNSTTPTFSLPPPAQFNQGGGGGGRTHERTPSTSSSIRTSSNDRTGAGGSVLDSPRGTYPTYPSPLQTHSSSIPYLSQHLSQSTSASNVAGGEGYNPSEPYIALSLPSAPTAPNQTQTHQFPSHLLSTTNNIGGGGGPSPASTTSYPDSPVTTSLGFCPPAPGPGVLANSPPMTSTTSQQPPATIETLQRAYDEKGKGKMIENIATAGSSSIGFVPPKAPSSSGGSGRKKGRATSIGSSNGKSSRKRVHTEEEGGEDEDEYGEEDEELGGGLFTREPVASTSNANGGNGARPTSIILPNSIDPITGQLRRQTEVPAVEDDPSVRPYGCNYCYLDRTVDPAIRAYWEQQESLNEGYKVSWRTVKELREHTQREHKERMDKLKELEQMTREEGGPVRDGKGPDLPFRCALEPCGKTFKSLAGLRFHFQNASANGHFSLTLEKDSKTGEERQTKKFKQDVQPNGRELSCPVDRCPKRFKQSAGLAYHLSHTQNHEVTEAMVSTFENTLQSKTRWWFRKLGLEFAQ
ncbi:uncharacterized protein JCM6883_001636 [Sporobolomyces salmoneus]|uniref:uncharacterized protein n=1 Tax=Sporobolomyces salmoneus TaxID=183962 RepID=UPI00317344F5